jgi:hypothetical protein
MDELVKQIKQVWFPYLPNQEVGEQFFIEEPWSGRRF